MSRRRTPRALASSATNRHGNCPSGKRRFREEVDAKIALMRAQNNAAAGDEERQEKRIYPCPQCHGWHLTSMPLNPIMRPTL